LDVNQKAKKGYSYYYTKKNKKQMRRPRIELGSTAWKATMLTITPATLGNEG
jgi:hypothetical protein